MSNRNACKQWSITFPQSGEVKREEFTNSFPPYDAAICSQEEHAEEKGVHLHLGLKIKKGLTKTKMLKWIRTRWPNDFKRIDVQPTRSIDCWNDYISKEDPEAFVFVDPTAKVKRLQRIKEKYSHILTHDTWEKPILARDGYFEIQQMKESGELERFYERMKKLDLKNIQHKCYICNDDEIEQTDTCWYCERGMEPTQ